ncbi:hypothetical protein RSAG8_12708, partial [Rhizoctonia solani AG-8 WAC10335]
MYPSRYSSACSWAAKSHPREAGRPRCRPGSALYYGRRRKRRRECNGPRRGGTTPVHVPHHVPKHKGLERICPRLRTITCTGVPVE